MPVKTVIVGIKINRLTAIKEEGKDKRGRKRFLWKCDCGVEKIIYVSAVVSNNTKSCGCYTKEAARKRRISENHSEITAIILGYKRHAKSRGIRFNLKRNEVESIIRKNCTYCGIAPSNKMKTKNSIGDGMFFSGIDRVNNNKNYTIDNSVPCCKVCNHAKAKMTIKEFLKWASSVHAQCLNNKNITPQLELF